MAMNLTMSVPISSTILPMPMNSEEMAEYNQTFALMNNTQIDGEDELLNTVVDEVKLVLKFIFNYY